MSGYNFGKINLPGPAGTFVYISVAGVDAAGLAVGNYGDSDDDFHGFTANSGTPVIFDPPDSSNTNVGGITNSGEIFGNYASFQNQAVGFVYNNGAFTIIDAPLAQETTVFGVTNGEVFGGYVDVFGGSHGFIDNNGVFTQIDAPGATSTTIMGVTPGGQLAGTILDSSNRAHGFIDNNGTFTTIDVPGSSGTFVVGISANGIVAGTYDDNANSQFGFTDTNGLISTISITGAIGTAVTGINASGETVGYYIDGTDNVHGFIDNGGFITTIDLPGVQQTDIQGVNDAGNIYGYYNDSTGQHGFVGTVTGPLPAVEFGTPDNDAFSASSAQKLINGNGGHDTIAFQGPRSEFGITLNNDGSLTVIDNGTSGDGTTQLLNVEALRFTDQTVFAENSDNANIARLYSAAFDRTPDTTGLFGWEDIYANNVPASVKGQGVYAALAESNDGFGTSIAGGFTNSAEFQADYGTLSNSAFVTLLYHNVLDRAPSQNELNSWLSLMTTGDSSGTLYTQQMTLVGFAESPENIAKTAGAWLIQV